jgi:hypothetical protein
MEDADRDIIGKTFARRSTFFGVAYEPSRHPNGYSSPDKARCGSFRKVPTADIANSANSRRKFGLRLMTAEKHQ